MCATVSLSNNSRPSQASVLVNSVMICRPFFRDVFGTECRTIVESGLVLTERRATHCYPPARPPGVGCCFQTSRMSSAAIMGVRAQRFYFRHAYRNGDRLLPCAEGGDGLAITLVPIHGLIRGRTLRIAVTDRRQEDTGASG